MRFSMILALGAVTASSLSAAVLRVPQDRPTIQSAIDAAAIGDVIRVGPGTYRESLVVTKGLTLESARGPQRTTIVGVGNSTPQPLMRLYAPAAIIRGFTFANAAASPQGIFIVGQGHRIEHNVFDGTRQAPGTAGVAIFVFAGSANITRNAFVNYRCDGQFLSGVVTITNSSPVELVNNLFLHNDCPAVFDGGQALHAVNNTLVRNRTGFALQAFGQLSNNIIVDGGQGITVASSFAPVVRNNLVHGNKADYTGMADPTGIDGNLDAAPGFVNPRLADFHLRRNSPAVDAGLDAEAPANDFDGVPRPQDGNADGIAVADIGAFERRGPRLKRH